MRSRGLVQRIQQWAWVAPRSRPLRHAAETWGGRRSALTLSWQRRSEVTSLRPQPRTHSATGETCSLSPTEDFATLSLLTLKGQTFPTGKHTWLFFPSARSPVIAFFVNFLLVLTSFSVVSPSAYHLSVPLLESPPLALLPTGFQVGPVVVKFEWTKESWRKVYLAPCYSQLWFITMYAAFTLRNVCIHGTFRWGPYDFHSDFLIYGHALQL